MIVVKEKDIAEIKASSLLADYDRETISILYQPIIGYTASALYFTLWSEAKYQNKVGTVSHKSLLLQMGISMTSFVDARKALEGTGLLKTYINDKDENKVFIYELYAPKNPKAFFDNTLLLGMLIKNVGEDNANRIKKIYSCEDKKQEAYDISSSFLDVFSPNFDDPAFSKALMATPNALGHNHGKINYTFSYEKFFDEMAKLSEIKAKDFSKKDMKEIERLATLYGTDEVYSAKVISDSLVESSKGHKIDFGKATTLFQSQTNYAYLSKRKSKLEGHNVINSDTELASKINLMENLSPKDYLSVLQNGSTPAKSDLFLINDLSKNFHLVNPVINVVVDYILETNNNILSKSYAEKIAASIAREGIVTAVDAMNYFREVTNKRTSRAKKTELVKNEVPLIKETKTNSKQQLTQEENLEWDKLINELDDGGDEDGKA